MLLSRREALRLIGLATASRPLCGGFGESAVGLDQSTHQDTAVQITTHLFRLSEVTLLEGTFRQSQDRNQEYLLSLDPDRLVAWFRREAGLTPKAPVYGGWESEAVAGPNQSLPGAMAGFYLSSMANCYANTHDPRIRERVIYMVAGLAECQQAFGDGYLLPTKNGHQLFERVADGEITTSNPLINGVWEPTYVLNKIMLGLYDVWMSLDIEQARTVLLLVADWLGTKVLDRLNDEQVQHLLVCEHGSLNESFVECFLATRDKKYLAWSKRLNDHEMLDPLSAGKDILDGWHANTQIPKFTGFHAVYRQTGEARFKDAAVNFWTIVTRNRSWVNGGNSSGERFFPAEQTTERMLATVGPESCNTVNMLRLTETLFEESASAELADYYERALYNHVLPVHEPHRGMCAYFMSMRPGHYRVYSSELDSFWCCVGTGIQSASRYGKFIYAKAESALYVNLFISSEVRWQEAGVTVRQETSFPDDGHSTLHISTPKSRRFSLFLRHPGWLKAHTLTVRINGQAQSIASSPSSYVELNRIWKNGDWVDVELPMDLRLEPLRSSSEYSGILYGPMILAGELGRKNLETEEFYKKMDQVPHRSISFSETPLLSGTSAQILESIQRRDKSRLAFSLNCPDKNTTISLSPLFLVHFQRYIIYWRMLPDDASRQQLRDALTSLEAKRTEVRTYAIDTVIAGDTTSENSHKFEEVSTKIGVEEEQAWRRATAGGWVSYQLAVQPATDHELWIEYHGAEFEPNQFTILINGQRVITEENLKNFELPVLYVKPYRIPANLIGSLDRVTIKLQAAWPSASARIFALSMVPQKG